MDDTDAELDALGLLCPLPVLKARKRLGALEPGQILKMLADDPAAVVDVPHFCAEAGHALLEMRTEGAVLTFLIKRGHKAPGLAGR
ncbi:sulfurtransferase TusA family protein [Oceaniglobus roseus]|uniref:sulfurtransferase TusA family protein n=1 Tax=Oceaniglobus roseus TaxID=1737570 RepID=UPI000C7F43BB|nr:sulfurtransferase TusA family protein [Kandeliimicrobium roseum]